MYLVSRRTSRDWVETSPRSTCLGTRTTNVVTTCGTGKGNSPTTENAASDYRRSCIGIRTSRAWTVGADIRRNAWISIIGIAVQRLDT
jgi:hypothetical protein